MTVVWRSLLYVPAHVERFVDNPRLAEADAVILDLEDSVPADRKAHARDQLAGAVTKVVAAGPNVLVRINDGALAEADIAAAVQPGVAALVVPKVRSAGQLQRFETRVSDAERRGGLIQGQIRFLVLIETADGFMAMRDILSASPRTLGVILGAEDFAADVGMVADAATLRGPRQQVVIAAAAAGVTPFGLMGATTRFDDLAAYRALAEESKRFGYVGSTCIHPSQVEVLNAAFSPDPDEVIWAQRVCAAFEAATRDGRGAVALDGRMIDAPVAARAETLLARHNAIQSKTTTKQGGLERAR
ncbi:citrate lyase subunit beta/citryl-CoA lyase [Brevundimonas vesicularis]|uniref:HpcH/HpaI aldolase/citrate lyase family protein n=1 Tax=Brevundimonas vesicularis TaxID=41276 RepID=UPI00277EF191|nr:CoA ester lyase [Brevundimonas vesicularis]MDQ1191576.1 citrate lyase subunit beta/citryl-CoA lyase [Brevundimonas vesicularis]